MTAHTRPCPLEVPTRPAAELWTDLNEIRTCGVSPTPARSPRFRAHFLLRLGEFVPGCWLVDLYFINNYGFRDSRDTDRQRQTHDPYLYYLPLF